MIGKTHGEIISWDMPTAVAIPVAQVTEALANAGLDPKVCRDRTARAAFSRACWTLADGRIIRKVEETPDVVLFQFTKEKKETSATADKELVYEKEAILMLDKKSGKVSAPAFVDQALVALTQAELDREAGTRYPSDITRIVQRLCSEHADLFPVRAHGGCYFVPDRYADFVEKLDNFMTAVGGTLRRFPIPAGTAHGDRSVKGAVKDGLQAMLKEYSDAVDSFDGTTRESTIEKMESRVIETKFKLELYREYLTDEADGVKKAVEELEAKFKAKIAALGEPEEPVLSEEERKIAAADAAIAAVQAAHNRQVEEMFAGIA